MPGVLLQGFYKLPPNNALPSPADGKPFVPWWWDHLASQAHALAQAGFTAIWLPPVLKTSTGAESGSDGYRPFDDYDIGSKKQKGSVPTRYGTREDLLRCAATLRANGLDIYLDMVEHHRLGDGGQPPEAFNFRYLGANGTPGLGRFPKSPSNFLPQVPRDPNLGGPPADDPPFGREFAPINAKPARYVLNNLIAAADWLTRTIGAQGYRIDDVKGLSTDFLLPMLNSEAMAGKFAVGEFFDGNTQLVNQWISNPQGMQSRVSAFDFPLKSMLTSMCNNPGRFNMADLDHAGLTGINPLHSVTFVENHDTDLQNTQKIFINKLLAYAYILTSEGYPSVFYKDYSTDPGCYGLQPTIDNLIWINEVLASGATQQRWKDFNVFAYERTGGSRLLVALNNDPNNTHTIQVTTAFGPNAHLKDYTGHSPDVFTDGGGNVSINVPQNIGGLGYVCYSLIGQDRTLVPPTHAAVQDIEGALDLDVLPAMNGETVTAGRIWCAADMPVQAEVKIDQTGWDANATVDVTLIAPSGSRTATLSVGSTTAPAVLQARTAEEGFHSLDIAASGLPATNSTPAFKLSLTYSAPQDFTTPDPIIPPAVAGQWEPVFDLKNVAIHAHLLPTGKVLYWGRRNEPGKQTSDSLNEHFCNTFLWDPETNITGPTAQQPQLSSGEGVNLFCSGHSFLPDGRLLVVGGHLFDSQGVNQACIYDPIADIWTAEPTMNNGRWYPTALTLPDGGVLVISGSFARGSVQPPPNGSQTNVTPEIWRGNTGTGQAWQPTQSFNTLQLFPRLHIEPTQGRVFMSGPQDESFFLDTQGAGTWSDGGPFRDNATRDYAPSVMYSSGKVIYIGGGLDPDLLPTMQAETIDLNVPDPKWNPTGAMHFRRRQHNATVLPDGTVLVTGGTQGIAGNASWLAFDNTLPGGPVHQAELWDPATRQFSLMAEEAIDRCYHSTALLLPDGRVLSAGGGEYAPNNPNLPAGQPNVNPVRDTHADAQIFNPPYLFKGDRPTMSIATNEITYGQSFEVTVGAADQIATVSLVKIGSVTHSFNMNQSLNFLTFKQEASQLTVQAPLNANIATPGHYMLFLLNEQGVPAIAPIVHIGAQALASGSVKRAEIAQRTFAPAHAVVDLTALNEKIVSDQERPPVIIGVSPSCPYGIGACWGGAFAALQRLSNIEVVRPIPDIANSIVFVYLKQDTLPDLDLWRDEFAKVINGSYTMRGIEITLSGLVTEELAKLTLTGTETRPEVVLSPLQAADKIQWDIRTRAAKPMSKQEASAFDELSAALVDHPEGAKVQVTGTLKKHGADFFLEVREFEVGPA